MMKEGHEERQKIDTFSSFGVSVLARGGNLEYLIVCLGFVKVGLMTKCICIEGEGEKREERMITMAKEVDDDGVIDNYCNSDNDKIIDKMKDVNSDGNNL